MKSGSDSDSFRTFTYYYGNTTVPFLSELRHKNDSSFMQNVLRVVQIKGFVRTLERTDFPLLGEFD